MAIRLAKCSFPRDNSWTAGDYSLRFTRVGNLELWDDTANRLLWQSKTTGAAVGFTMQDNGNLVIYGENEVPLWASHSGGGDRGAYLVLQDDGNLVIYSRDDMPLWSTDTNPEQQQS